MEKQRRLSLYGWFASIIASLAVLYSSYLASKSIIASTGAINLIVMVFGLTILFLLSGVAVFVALVLLSSGEGELSPIEYQLSWLYCLTCYIMYFVQYSLYNKTPDGDSGLFSFAILIGTCLFILNFIKLVWICFAKYYKKHFNNKRDIKKKIINLLTTTEKRETKNKNLTQKNTIKMR